MGILRYAALAGVLLAAPPRPQGDPAEARARVDKAVAALGGADALAKVPAVTWEAKGTYYGAGKEGLAFEAVGARQGADRLAVSVETKGDGARLTRSLVVAGDKGWLVLDGRRRPLSKEELAEERERLYAQWVATLAPLRGKEFRLTTAGAARVAGRDAVVVLVRGDGRRDVRLYLDKEKHLLLKRESVIRDVLGGGKEVKEEVLYADYAEAGGVRYARRVRVLWDGRLVSTSTVTEYRPAGKLADKVFARPDAEAP